MAYAKKEYERETWVNVPDPSTLSPDELNLLPRFDADNMNRIENGIENALNLTPDDIGALAKTTHFNNVDVLSIAKDGLYYVVGAINIPTTSATYGYVRVCVADVSHRVICWRPAGSIIEYTNVMVGGEWLGWTETLTSKGGILNGNIVVEMPIDPTIQVRETSSGRTSAFQQDSNGLKIINYNTNDGNDYSAIWLFPKNISGLSRVLQLQEGAAESYYVFGQHNKPNGSYTGIYEYEKNSGKRTIDTGGIGDVLFIVGDASCAFVTSNYSVLYSKVHTGGYTVDSKTTYLNGRLTIPENRFEINDLGITYRWYCL